MTEVETPQTDSVCGWLAGNPLAASAGSTLYGWYEGTKGYTRVGEYALESIESSVKYAADTAAPLVRKLDKPIQAVDSFAAKQLTKLEEKVPAIKAEPAEVVTYLTDSKEAISTKLSDGHTAIKARVCEGKEAITSRVAFGKDAVVSTIQAGTEALSQTRVATMACEGKDALAVKLSQGKEAVSTRLVQGKDAVYSTVQTGASAVANTRAGVMVGSSIDSTLRVTENLVDYLLPAEENEKELLSEYKKSKEPIEMMTLKSSEESIVSEEEVVVTEEVSAGRVVRVKTLSRKVKLRMYYRSLRKLQGVQEQSKSLLEQLKTTIDLLKMARELRDKAGQQYENLTTTIKDLEGHVKDMLCQSAQGEEKVSWLPDESEGEIQWLKPYQPVSRVQATLDYAKQLSGKAFSGLQTVYGATSYLPHHLKGGANQAYEYAKELYTTLKPVQSPADLSKKALDRMSEIIDTQLGYVRGLGNYLASALKRGRGAEDDDEDDDERSEVSEVDQDEQDDEISTEPSTSQPPGSEDETTGIDDTA